jgi:phosphatidyl-myo-inositol alpha-mannosyltransferase
MSAVLPAIDAYCPALEAATAVKPIRVLHLINGEHYAGAERVQDLLALRLNDFGFDVGFACTKPGQFPALRQAQQQPLYEMPMRGKLDLLGPAWSLARLIHREGYALLHTHTARSALLGRLAAGLACVPMVHHVHSPAAAESTHRWRNWLNARSERFSVRGAKAVVPVSASLAQYLERAGIRSSYVSVVPNGVPVRGPLEFRPHPTGTWTLGTVALFRPRKGIEVLLSALAQLRDAGITARLRAVGSFETPQYEADIKSLAEQLGVAELVEWRGFARDVYAELDAMDLFVLPSLFGEGMPMVILEAMAAGLPVIGTRVEGVPEVVRDEIDGLITEPGDAISLGAAIARFIRRDVDWEQMRAAAHHRQAEHFSDRSMAAGVAHVYREVLA